MQFCSIVACVGPCVGCHGSEGKGKIDSDRLQRVWPSLAKFNRQSALMVILSLGASWCGVTQQADSAPKDRRAAEASKAR